MQKENQLFNFLRLLSEIDSNLLVLETTPKKEYVIILEQVLEKQMPLVIN